MAELVNRVANSGLITINLETYFPNVELVEFDLKAHLYQALILKEKDFRQQLKELDWDQYAGKVLCVYCSADAIIPIWAYMLVSAYAADKAQEVFQGTKVEYIRQSMSKRIQQLDASIYEGKRIVIKGCSNKPVPNSAYLDLTAKLRPYAQSIMFGEPCSTVPIFKRPRKINKS